MALAPPAAQCRIASQSSDALASKSPRKKACSWSFSSRLEKNPTMAAASSASAISSTSSEELNSGIASFYDASSGVWEDVWGEHMHHGFYEPGKPLGDHRQAQIRMIEKSLAWAGVPDDSSSRPRTVVDVGCGIGGSSRYLSKKYSAIVKGITLSPVQAGRATALTASAGLGDKVSFQVADALNQPFGADEFDLVWSMESGEHMPDKKKFMEELVRVATPGGRILIVTWCHRDLLPGETSLTQKEKDLLDKICKAYFLPAWCSTSDYVKLAKSLELEDVKSEDWSEYVSPFWPAVVASAFKPKALFGLLKSGWTTLKGALAMAYMIQGYKSGLIKFALISGKKPEHSSQ